MMKKFCLGMMLIALLAGVHTPGSAKEIVDMSGRRVTVPDHIKKVYSASPPATCLVYAMCPKMVAGLNFRFTREDTRFIDPDVLNLPVVGGWFGQGQVANVESILNVSPDIILIWTWQGSAVDENIMAALAPTRIPVVRLVMETVSDYPGVFRFLGELLNMRERGDVLAVYAEETLRQVAAATKKIPEKDRLRVYYAEGPDGFSTECHTSLHAVLVPLSGGVNVHKCMDRSAYGMQKISVEQILMYDPQVIVAHDPFFFQNYQKDARWQQVQAVMKKRMYRIPSEPFNWFDRPPSFMQLIGLRWMTNKCYPELYPIDITAETKRFYQLFLNVTLEDDVVDEVLFQ